MATCNIDITGEAVIKAVLSNDSDNPNEYFLDDMELESLHMFGREWTEKDMRVYFGDMGADGLLSLLFAETEGMEWDDDELQ